MSNLNHLESPPRNIEKTEMALNEIKNILNRQTRLLEEILHELNSINIKFNQ